MAIRNVVAASENDPLRRRFIHEAFAFHGLTSAASSLWSASVHDRNALTGEVLAYFATTPLRPDTPEWLGQCLHRITAEMLDPENQRRLRAVSSTIERLDVGVPAEVDFERRTGITISELEARLPEGPSGSVPSVRELVHDAVPGSANRGLRRRRQRRLRTWYAAATIAATAATAVLSLQLLSNALTSPATAWAESESFSRSSRVGSLSRGVDLSVDPAAGRASSRALSDLGIAWSELRAARRTRLGFLPHYELPKVRIAADGFRRAARYPSLPDAVRADAIYGSAVSAWLVGDHRSAIRSLSNPALEFSPLADRSRELRARLESTTDSGTARVNEGQFRVP